MRRSPVVMLVAVLSIVVCGAIGLSAGTARGASESDPIKDGVAAYDALEYEKAVTLLDAALTSRGESLTHGEKVTALRTLALAHFALGHEDQTRAVFERLLHVDPSVQLDRRQAPRVRVLLEETRAKVATQGTAPAPPAGLEPVPVTTQPAALRENTSLTVHVPDASHAAPTLTLYHRSGGARAFSRVDARRLDDGHGGFDVPIAGSLVRAPQLELYVVLLDPAGAPVAGAGSLADPVRLPVRGSPKPLYKKAWFWGTLGGILVAGGIAAVLAVELRPQPPASVTLQPH